MHLNQKIDSLTGLRFLAAAAIVIGHAHDTFGSANIAKYFSLSQGVSMFFILSGFILALNYPSLSNNSSVNQKVYHRDNQKIDHPEAWYCGCLSVQFYQI